MKKTKLLLLIGFFSFVCIQSSFTTEFNSVEFGLNNRTKYFQNIAFVPGNGINVVAVAQLASIWHSSDNGANWRQVKGPSYENPVNESDIPTNDSTLLGVGFVDNQIGFACGGTKNVVSILFYTADGGLTWTDVSSQLPADLLTKGLIGVCPVNESTVYIQGTSGNVIKGSKSGSIWTYTKKASIGTGTADAFGFDFAGSTAFATLQGSKLYKNATIDDDLAVWSQVTYTPGWGTIYLMDVEFADANNGLTVGNLGKILKTADGGTTWTEVSSGVTSNLRRIAYENALNVYVVGQQGTILESLDGGTTWAKATSNTTREIKGVDSKNGQILAVCFHGTILSYPAQVPNALNNVAIAKVAVSPNPALDYLQIKCDKTISGITITDLTGKSVLSVKNYSTSVYVGNLAKGIYFVSIKTNEGNISVKFCKE